MPYTGRGFVGFIGYSPAIPEIVQALSLKQTGTGTVSVTLGPPLGVAVGDTMVACVSAGQFASAAGASTMTAATGWTTVYADPSGTNIMSNLYTRTADAADAAGTSSYVWTYTHSGAGLSGMVVLHLSWEAKYGSTLSGGVVDHTLTPSVGSPGGRWQFSYIVQRTGDAFAQPAPDPTVTSTATLLAEAITAGSDSYRAGNLRAYGSTRVSPITGNYANVPALPSQGLVVAAVSA